MIGASRAISYRRFYLYAALSIATIALSVAASVALRTALQLLGLGPRPASAEVSRAVSLAVAIAVFALPVGAAHLWLALRALRDPAERAAARRHEFLNLWVAAALVAALFAGSSLIAALLQDSGGDPAVGLAVLLVAVAVGAVAAAWIARTPPGTVRPRVRAAVTVLLVAMAWAAFSFGNAASSAGGLFADAARGSARTGLARVQERTLWMSLLLVALALVVWAVAFARQRHWPATRERLTYLLLGYGSGTLLLLGGLAFELAGLIRYARDPAEAAALTAPWGALVAGALLVLVHGFVLLRDRGRNGHPAVVGTRLLLAFPALVAPGALVAGLVIAWRAFVLRDSVRASAFESDVALAAGLALVGAATWPVSWSALLRRAPAESVIRRFVLYTVVCLALVGTLVTGVIALYNAIAALAGVGGADAGLIAASWSLPAIVLALVFAAHLALLARDQRRARAAAPQPALAEVSVDDLAALLEDVRAGRRSVADAAGEIRAGGVGGVGRV